MCFPYIWGWLKMRKWGFWELEGNLKSKSLCKANQRILEKVYKIAHLTDCQFRHFSERSLAFDAEILALDLCKLIIDWFIKCKHYNFICIHLDLCEVVRVDMLLYSIEWVRQSFGPKRNDLEKFTIIWSHSKLCSISFF